MTIGSANDAQDHGSGEEAERMRQVSCDGIRRLMAQHAFLRELLPGLQAALDSGHILGFGWAQLSDRVDALLKETGAEPGGRSVGR